MIEMPNSEQFKPYTEGNAASAPPSHGGTRRKPLRRALLGIVAAAWVGAGAYYGRDYWMNGRFLPSTDHAYETCFIGLCRIQA